MSIFEQAQTWSTVRASPPSRFRPSRKPGVVDEQLQRTLVLAMAVDATAVAVAARRQRLAAMTNRISAEVDVEAWRTAQPI